MTHLHTYFPEYPQWDWQKIEAFAELIRQWNQKVNLISRKDIDALYPHHIIPSLALAKVIHFKNKTKILDVGTGGGFPGLPLAICFPEVQFTLIDSIGKKIKIVQAIAQELGLKNVTTHNIRAEQHQGFYDFVIGRAVSALPEFISWVLKNLDPRSQHTVLNGILYLKGGDGTKDLVPLGIKPTTYPLGTYFQDQLCQDKSVIHLGSKKLLSKYKSLR